MTKRRARRGFVVALAANAMKLNLALGSLHHQAWPSCLQVADRLREVHRHTRGLRRDRCGNR